jgi:transcription elongation factor GreA
MGSGITRDAVRASWPAATAADTVFAMTQTSLHVAEVETRPVVAAHAARGVTLTATGFDELVRELELMQSTYRTELAQRLRDARTFGSPGDDDDRLAVLEDLAIDQVRITQLERLVAGATIVDEAPSSDGAGLGSFVWVQDEAGRAAQYELVGRRSGPHDDGRISLASPVGTALLGSRPGDVVQVALPNGRERSLTVLDVREGTQGRRDRLDVAA